jgi:hypothetical protein
MTKLNAASEPIKILRKLQAYGYKSGIIAGGAVRDDYLNEEISDYDFFLFCPDSSTEFSSIPNEDTMFRKIFGTSDMEKIHNGGYGNLIQGIYELRTDYQIYQVIYTPIDPVQYVNKYFDVGLCKAYCDGKKIRYTPDFLRDVKEKTLSIVAQEMTQDQFNYTMDVHVDKLKWKYPNYDICIPHYNIPLYVNWQNS